MATFWALGKFGLLCILPSGHTGLIQESKKSLRRGKQEKEHLQLFISRTCERNIQTKKCNPRHIFPQAYIQV